MNQATTTLTRAGLLALFLCKRLACITRQQYLKKSSQMKLELLEVGMRCHE